jgi:hypothetical protein
MKSKIKTTLIVMIYLIIFLLSLFFITATTFPACCCFSNQVSVIYDAIDEYDCQFEGGRVEEGDATNCAKVCEVETCDNCQTGSCSDYDSCSSNSDGGICPSGQECCSGSCSLPTDPGQGCQDPNLDIKPISLTRGNDRGYRQITLTWNDNYDCDVVDYQILRCDANGCNPTTVISSTTQKSFVDTNINWGTIYRYIIKGTYVSQGQKNSDVREIYSGDSPCEGHYTSARFCVGNSNSFCSISNLLSGTQNCNSGEICAGGNCIALSDCDQPSGNPFGLYHSVGSCEGSPFDYKYCFLDKSKTNVDMCYSCGGNNMTCYDYKSKGACERDNCMVGLEQEPSSCRWNWVYEDLGIGVCVDKEADNCGLCKSKGTTTMATINFEAFNDVFDVYSRSKLKALSTEKYPCFESGNTCTSCGDIGCPIYTNQQDCSSLVGAVTLNNVNDLVTKSGDSCGIDICRWYNGACKKDGDGISILDCDLSENPDSCEKDYFKPNTNITEIKDHEGIVSGFTITITDKTKKSDIESVKTSSDYKIKYCIVSNGSSCIPRTVNHGFKETTSRVLALAIVSGDLKLCAGTCDANSINLESGLNTLKYYSIDPANNPGIVKELQFLASPEFRPVVSAAYIQDSTFINNVYYTNNPKPTIKINYSDDTKLFYYRLEDSLGNPINLLDISSISTIFQKTHTLRVENILANAPKSLEDGTYTFFFNAKNIYEKSMLSNHQFTFVVGTNIPELTITPNNVVVDKSPVPINLSFTGKAILNSVYLNDQDITDNFVTTNNEVFSATYTLIDGMYNVSVDARDYGGNQINGFANFEVNAVASPLVISLVRPTYGISATHDFDFEVVTDNKAICKYKLNVEDDYDHSKIFNITNGDNHIITPLTIDDLITHKIYIKCKDIYYNTITATNFTLQVDTSKPNITAWADPRLVATSPAFTNIKVTTDDITICTYELYYTSGNFSGYNTKTFKTSHQQELLDIPAHENPYNFKIVCMNRAELSNNVTSSFNVSNDAPLDIIDGTPDIFTNTSIPLKISVNLDTTCRYSNDKSNWNYFSKESTLVHKSVIIVPGNGNYKYYVQCEDSRVDRWLPEPPFEITFAVDSTPPNMIYVNDSSNEDNPEYTWRNDRLRVKWLGEDNDTGVSRYHYRLREHGSEDDIIINWTTRNSKDYEDDWAYVDEDYEGENLNLTDGQKYQFDVRPENSYGLIGSDMSSDGITIDIAKKPEHCDNGIKDGNETDIDCGGPCGGCNYTQSCIETSDCITILYCNTSKQCDYPGCSDNIKNGDETDIDCGGKDCSKCDNGDNCNKASDCISNYCNAATGKCSVPDKCNNNKLDPGETGIDCGGPCPGCGDGDFCDIDEDCESGLKCIEGICRKDSDGDGILDTEDNCPNHANLDQADLDGDGIGDACDEDIDGDGLTNEFENKYNLDPYNKDSDGDGIFDGEEDEDNDGLTNREEQDNGYNYCLDPWNKDTDGDGFSDKKEVDKGTDGCDANSKPSSSWWLFWLLLFLVIIVSLLYLTYPEYKKYIEKSTSKYIPKPITSTTQFKSLQSSKPIQPLVSSKKQDKKMNELEKLIERKRKEKEEKRKGLFSTFGVKKEEKKEFENKILKSSKEVEKEEKKSDIKTPWLNITDIIKKENPREESKNIFNKLKEISKEQKKSNQDIFNKLEQVSKKSKIIPVIVKQKEVKKDIPVVSTKNSKVYHKKGCITIKGKKNLVNYATETETKNKGLKKCSVCFPKK